MLWNSFELYLTSSTRMISLFILNATALMFYPKSTLPILCNDIVNKARFVKSNDFNLLLLVGGRLNIRYYNRLTLPQYLERLRFFCQIFLFDHYTTFYFFFFNKWFLGSLMFILLHVLVNEYCFVYFFQQLTFPHTATHISIVLEYFETNW